MTYGQEIYIEYILQGYNHREAFLKAFPSTKGKKPSIIDSMASQLFIKKDVQEYYQKRKAEVQSELKERAVWNKELAMNELLDMLYTNKKESKRYEEAFYDELGMIDRRIAQAEKDMKKARISKKEQRRLSEVVDDLKAQRIQVCKRHISNKSVNEAILSSITQLNEIMDFKNEALRNIKESENRQKIEILFGTDIEKGNDDGQKQD